MTKVGQICLALRRLRSTFAQKWVWPGTTGVETLLIADLASQCSSRMECFAEVTQGLSELRDFREDVLVSIVSESSEAEHQKAMLL